MSILCLLSFLYSLLCLLFCHISPLSFLLPKSPQLTDINQLDTYPLTQKSYWYSYIFVYYPFWFSFWLVYEPSVWALLFSKHYILGFFYLLNNLGPDQSNHGWISNVFQGYNIKHLCLVRIGFVVYNSMSHNLCFPKVSLYQPIYRTHSLSHPHIPFL